MSQNPIPSDWDENSWCNYIVCWPDSQLWRGLLLGLVTSPMRGRFWDGKTGTITDAQITGRTILELNKDLEVGCMSCSQAQELTDAMISAMASFSGGGAGCSTGSGCAGAEEPPPSEVEPGPPGEQVGDPPDGFDTWADYEEYKCAIATWIVEGLEVDLAWAETIDIVALTVTGLAAALLIPVPFSRVAAILAFFAALSAQGVFLTGIQSAQAAVAANFDELVCSLYQSADAEGAKANWAAETSDAVDGETGAFWAGIVKEMLKTWVGYAPINYLFEENIPLRNTIAPGDCSSCDSCPQAWVFGAGDIDGGGVFTSAPFSAEHRIQFNIGYQQHAQITAITGWVNMPGSVNDFRAHSTLNAACGSVFGKDVLDQDTPPALPFTTTCVESVTIRSLVPFTITWNVIGPGVGCP